MLRPGPWHCRRLWRPPYPVGWHCCPVAARRWAGRRCVIGVNDVLAVLPFTSLSEHATAGTSKAHAATTLAAAPRSELAVSPLTTAHAASA
jgi:hypothetical protein